MMTKILSFLMAQVMAVLGGPVISSNDLKTTRAEEQGLAAYTTELMRAIGRSLQGCPVSPRDDSI